MTDLVEGPKVRTLLRSRSLIFSRNPPSANTSSVPARPQQRRQAQRVRVGLSGPRMIERMAMRRGERQAASRGVFRCARMKGFGWSMMMMMLLMLVVVVMMMRMLLKLMLLLKLTMMSSNTKKKELNVKTTTHGKGGATRGADA